MTRANVTSPKEKYVTFKRAFDTIKTYREQKNYLAAYVVSFSVIEDRVRALYVKWHHATKMASPSDKQVNGSFSGLVTTLAANDAITTELAGFLKKEAVRRNELLHAAMWNLNALSDDLVEEVIKIARDINNADRRAATRFKKINIKT